MLLEDFEAEGTINKYTPKAGHAKTESPNRKQSTILEDLLSKYMTSIDNINATAIDPNIIGQA